MHIALSRHDVEEILTATLRNMYAMPVPLHYTWISMDGVEDEGKSLPLVQVQCASEKRLLHGNVRACEACGALFMYTKDTQRFCPPHDGQHESACAIRARVRTHRHKALKARALLHGEA